MAEPQETAEIQVTVGARVAPTQVLPAPTQSATAMGSQGWVVARWVVASVLAILGALAVPLSLAQHWVQQDILDRANFVAKYGPLAGEPAFQELLTAQTTANLSLLIEQNLPTEQVGNLLDGLGGVLDEVGGALDFLPTNPLEFLKDTGIETLPDQALGAVDDTIYQAAADFYASEDFPPLWAAALNQIHQQLVGTLDGTREAPLNEEGEAELTLDLGPLVNDFKQVLQDQGQWWAGLIPTVEGAVPVIGISDLGQLQMLYQVLASNPIYLQAMAALLLLAALAIAPKRWLMASAAALLTAATSAVLIYALPAFGSKHFQALTDMNAQAVERKVWEITTGPLTQLASAWVMGSLVVAIVAAGVALALSLHRSKRAR